MASNRADDPGISLVAVQSLEILNQEVPQIMVTGIPEMCEQ